MLRFGRITVEDVANVGHGVPRNDLRIGPGLRLHIPLVNTSDKMTYHVVACPRHISYDSGTRTLAVGFASQTPPAETRRFFLPELVAILPDQEAVLTATVENNLFRAKIVGDRLTHHYVDITAWTNLAVTIAFDASPFRVMHPSTGTQTWEQFHRWGQKLEGTFDRSSLASAA